MAKHKVRPSVESLESRRLLTAGQLDPSFSRDGKAFAPFAGEQGEIYAVAVQPDRKVVIAGATLLTNYEFAIARFNADGTPDNSFGTKGLLVFSPYARAEMGDTSERATSLVITPSGQIVVGGFGDVVKQVNGQAVFHDAWVVVRLNANGAFDDTFGTKGVAVSDFGLNEDSHLRKLLLTPSGAVLGVGDAAKQAVVARFGTDGKLDKTFNSQGFNRFRFSGGLQATLSGVALARDGKIVVAGVAGTVPDDGFISQDSDVAVARLNTDGSFDGTFGPFDNGKMTLDASAALGTTASFPDASYDVAAGVTVDKSGRVVVGATVTTLKEDEGGGIVVPLSSPRAAALTPAALTPAPLEPRTTWALIRFTAEGDADGDFGKSGVKAIDLPDDVSPYLASIVPYGSSRYILTSGATSQFNLFGRPTVMRVLADGRPDKGFGTNGLAKVPLAGAGAFFDAAVFADGNVALAGIQSVNDDDLLFAAKLQGDPGTVRGTVFNDLNGDGNRNSNDLGLPNAKVFLDLDNNNRLDAGEPSATTDAKGNYVIANVGPGEYRLRPVPVTGVRTSYPGSGIRRIMLAAGQTLASQTFLVTTRSRVEGSIFNDDTDGDGKRDPGEDGLAGWTLLADADKDGKVDPGEPVQQTDANGDFRFINLKPGTYRIVAIPPSDADWLFTTPTSGFFDITVKAGQLVTGLIFGEVLL